MEALISWVMVSFTCLAQTKGLGKLNHNWPPAQCVTKDEHGLLIIVLHNHLLLSTVGTYIRKSIYWFISNYFLKLCIVSKCESGDMEEEISLEGAGKTGNRDANHAPTTPGWPVFLPLFRWLRMYEPVDWHGIVGNELSSLHCNHYSEGQWMGQDSQLFRAATSQTVVMSSWLHRFTSLNCFQQWIVL